MEARFFTDVGHTRENNEDAGGILTNHTGQQLLIVCDGMGGHNSGEVASHFVATRLKQIFEQENLIEFNQAEDWLKSRISEINRELYDKSQHEKVNQGMGTTLVAAMLFDKKVIIANVGDSRSYLINEREMRQLTIDHTFVQHLVMAGELTKEEAAQHPQRNIITKVIGTDRTVIPDIFTFPLSRYDYLLLSSDGLTDYVPENQVHDIIMQETSLTDKGERMIKLALESEVRDNVSFVLCKLGGVF
ncbi:Stp1/IreP family PP2C-type Ser/Thr phosphatase [Macrococcus brunensis]|uniref:Stp1/IreP family PP2C-type Ser/Thr phosphatase n=1 Tax=Macrococcus brunensis TaxID=198483 RepID=UPI001EEFB2F9|nr:Stp1/IreP family PP2C-type Ser/Thr phosphatase [Macrococcus brunensis]ULG72837.1 Stp1/IreP family PP2C-type Ser/Thr phosphatase [Macrococcus brunensis]ULG75087.1 Stp1/IreP family PP2C-type Ser/Thr phosphatase [Macrococcus brunensis]